MLSRVRAHQRGDTIVEVLIVLAVLGLAIGISYATANRSLQNARQAQESSKATELLRSQLESVRVLAAAGSTDPLKNVFIAGPFCIDSLNEVKPSRVGPNPNPACIFNELYNIEITQDHNTFTLVTRWDDVAGQGKDKAQLIYRWYKP